MESKKYKDDGRVTRVVQRRAKAIAKHVYNQDAENSAKILLTKEQYWKQCVKNEQDVIQYYKLYHPDYPEILARAFASKLSSVIERYNQSQISQLSDREIQLIEPISGPSKSQVWDPMEDIQKEMLLGKIALAERSMQQLLNE